MRTASSRRTFLKATVAGVAALGHRRVTSGQITTTNSTVPTLSDAPQLFVDLDRVEQLANIRQVYHAAWKHPGNPVLRKVKPWEHDRGAWGNVMYDPDDKVFKAWYGGTSGRQKEYRPGSLSLCSVLCYATSKDGVN